MVFLVHMNKNELQLNDTSPVVLRPHLFYFIMSYGTEIMQVRTLNIVTGKSKQTKKNIKHQ